MTKVHLMLLVTLLVTNSCREKAYESIICKPEIIVVAHRGAHNILAENSIASIREAIEIGVDIVEIDVRHTKDNYLVLMHDSTIDRTTNGSGLVRDYTLEEIKEFRLKNASGTLVDERVPTLEEVFVKYGEIIDFDLDIKTPNFIQVVEMVEEYNLHQYILFLLYNLEDAIRLKEYDKRFRILMRGRDEESVRQIIRELNPEAIHIDKSFNTVLVNEIIKNSGSRSFINSLGRIDKEGMCNPQVYDELLEKGVNMIQTDNPELLLRYLRLKGLR